MRLLTPQLHTALRANAITRRGGETTGASFDPVPLVKLFNPLGAATWLATELDEDCDTLFGLADLGFGCPELGYFSLTEISAVRPPFVAQETGEAEPLPCRIPLETDDAAAIEASMIENLARLDADEVTQWETFTRLVKEGRDVTDIAATFGLPDLTIARVLALGNLLPRIRSLYGAEKINRATVRHLTLASKSQQRAWLALFDDPDSYVPTGHQLKAWLFGGQSIPARFALFDLDGFKGATVADLFGEDQYFADADAFWAAQNDAIEARRAAYLEEGWSDVVIVPASEHFHSWEYEKAGKRKGGRVHVDVRSTGEVTFHEGYLSAKEARRVARGDGPEAAKIARPEVTSSMQTYLDLHRQAAVRAALLGHPGIALRLMVAHAIGGSHLWRVKASIRPCERDNEKSPDHRVSASGVEFGAAWTKAAREAASGGRSTLCRWQYLDDFARPVPGSNGKIAISTLAGRSGRYRPI